MFAVELWLLAKPVGGLEAETAHVHVSWVGYVAGEQLLVVGDARPVPRMRYESKGTCAPGGSGGSLWCGSWGTTGLGAGSHPVQHKCSMQFQHGGLIIPRGPALF